MKIESDPSAADVAALEDALYAFNMDAARTFDGRSLAIFLKDEADALYAGVSGHTWGGVCEIKLLAEARRGQGLGAQLMDAVEGEARARGCGLVLLSSHSFQAPEFYQKRGYREVGRVRGYPRGFDDIRFAKTL